MIARLSMGGLFILQFLLLGLTADVAASRDPLPLPMWQDEVLVSGVASRSPSALALDSKGTAHTIYQKSESEALHWGTGSGDAWESTEIARVSTQGLHVAIAVDTADTPHIAYTDGDEDELLYGVRQAGQWQLQRVAPAGEVLALVTGRDDRPQLISVEQGRLIYRTKVGQDWLSEFVSAAGVDVENAQLALDSRDRPHVAYTGSGGSSYAVRQEDGSWAADALPVEAVVGLALAPDDTPSILHSEATWAGFYRYPIYDLTLYASEWVNGGWQERHLCSEQVLGGWPYWDGAEIAVGAGGRVHTVCRLSYGEIQYNLHVEAGESRSEWFNWSGGGAMSLALGPNGEPRLLTHNGEDLVLLTRRVLLLENFSLLPVVGTAAQPQ